MISKTYGWFFVAFRLRKRRAKESFMITASHPMVCSTSHAPTSGHAAPESELRAHLAAYWPDLYRRALRLTRNDAIAQDVIQDTLERALRFEDQYEPHSNLRAWLQRILHSVFVTRCRRLRRERRALENLTNDPCSWTLPDSHSVQRALSPAVARALASLPEPFRRAVELVDLADLSYRDAAASLGIPLGTIMSRLHRGRRMLAEALRPATDGLVGGRSSPADGLVGGRSSPADGETGLPEAA
jgi:RNA polymerase sigma-70 factor (ECF subfamily)